MSRSWSLCTTIERRSEPDSVPERYLVRVAARDGDVSLEGLITLSVESPMWRRAEEIPGAPYLDLLRAGGSAPPLRLILSPMSRAGSPWARP